jgi:ATP-dependent helicase/nuclease subunit A
MSLAQPLAAERQEADPGLDPAHSIWVSASAGSGKTTLLTRRVMRLLLEGARRDNAPLPNILCLTYTKGAAAEMQNRIQSHLANWAIAEEGALGKELFDVFGMKAGPAMLKRARQLFAEILERPQHVRIMTVHAFCQMILARFPLEAGLAPHFTLLEGQAQQRFEEDALSAFLTHVAQSPPEQAALETLSALLGGSRTRDLLQQVFTQQSRWQAFFDRYPSDAAFAQNLARRLHLENPPGMAGYLQSLCNPPEEAALRAAVAIMMTGSKTEKDNAAIIAPWLAAPDRRAAMFDAYTGGYLTKTEGTIKKALYTKDFLKKNPDLAVALDREAIRVEAAVRSLKTLRFYHQQAAYITLARGLWKDIQRRKSLAANLTYDDLILRAQEVLNRRAASQWILYKLDGGFDHILVDEAQDTSPAQWEIVYALLEEFFSGTGARADARRTVFVVGDEKQSIFSFQGADRSSFMQAREWLLEKSIAADRPMRELPRNISYRTAPHILAFVDAVFGDEASRGGVSSIMRHESKKAQGTGLVEFWAPIYGGKREAPEPWQPPLQREEAKPPAVQLAERMAASIRTWLDEGRILKSRNRPVEARDILILLQRRSTFLAPLVRALKDQHIPVAGVDRMVLRDQGAVQDVLALCRFLLLPEDDLTLAEVLRGPFIRLSDEQLFTLAHGRTGSLWQSLQAAPAFAAATGYLKTLLGQVDFITPFALLHLILFHPCAADAISGQHALIHRLGPDAADPLEELLSLARRHESENAPSLQLFVEALSAAESEVKRELSKPGGEVRILTVHGAKGLEAPIVFVPDLMRDPHRKAKIPSLYWRENILPMAAMPKAAETDLLDAARDDMKAADSEEHRRLLYVALTRPEDMLILCGAANTDSLKDKPPPWYAHALAGMERLNVAPECNPAGEPVLWRYGDETALALPEKRQVAVKAAPAPLPVFLRRNLADVPSRESILNPSRIGLGGEKVLPPGTTTGLSGRERGVLFHRLLEILPDVASGKRREAALTFLCRQTGLPPEECRTEAEEIFRLLEDETMQDLFGPGSRAEVPVIGYVQGRKISGQIDRLVETGSEVLVLDYKTNRPPPEREEDVAPAYLAQMAAYRLLLRPLYPGKAVRCALLWTHVPRLMVLTADYLYKGEEILRRA